MIFQTVGRSGNGTEGKNRASGPDSGGPGAAGRVWERLSAGQRREIPAFSCFLSLREQELVRRLMGEETLTFFGGYSRGRAGGGLLFATLSGGEQPVC